MFNTVVILIKRFMKKTKTNLSLCCIQPERLDNYQFAIYAVQFSKAINSHLLTSYSIRHSPHHYTGETFPSYKNTISQNFSKSQYINLRQADKPSSVVERSSIQARRFHRTQAVFRTQRAAAQCPIYLASDGVYIAIHVTTNAVSSYLTFPSSPDKSGSLFLLHFP